jgi:hypothetical protein
MQKWRIARWLTDGLVAIGFEGLLVGFAFVRRDECETLMEGCEPCISISIKPLIWFVILSYSH